MPALLLWLGNLATAFVAWMAGILGKQVAVTVAIVAVIVALTAAFWAAITGLANGLIQAVPAEVVTVATWIAPTNLDECLALVLTGELMRYVYDQKILILRVKASVS